MKQKSYSTWQYLRLQRVNRQTDSFFCLRQADEWRSLQGNMYLPIKLIIGNDFYNRSILVSSIPFFGPVAKK
jgi:hypothetical protein